MHVCALEVFHEDLFQVRPSLDFVGWKVFQPRSHRIGQEQWKVAANEIITFRSTGLASKPIILEPQSGFVSLEYFEMLVGDRYRGRKAALRICWPKA